MLVIGCTSSAQVVRQSQEQLGTLRWTQVHPMYLPSVGISGIMQARSGSTFEQAARWAQCSDGWPLYLQTLWQEGTALTNRCPPQPQTVTSTLLAELSGLPAPALKPLTRLAQIHDRFDPELAEVVLGQGAAQVLQVACQHNVLVPAAGQETVTFPELQSWVDDTETHLTFTSEVLRVALARQLPPAERQQVRTLLARYYQGRCAPLHDYYARRTGLPCSDAPAAEQARPALKTAPLAPLPAYTPPLLVGTRQEFRTANSYRVALENGCLEIMRKGSLGPAPQLRVSFGTLPAGRWQLKLRLDVFRNYTRQPAPVALAVWQGDTRCASYAPEPPSDPCSSAAFGLLPMHQWVLMQGQSDGGEFSLEVRGMDIALSISELCWNGQNLLFPRTHQA